MSEELNYPSFKNPKSIYMGPPYTSTERELEGLRAEMELVREYFRNLESMPTFETSQTLDQRPLIGVDRRTRLSKFPMVIQYLRELNYKEGDVIPVGDVLYVLSQVLGFGDNRTLRAYLHLLVKYGYLVEASKMPENICSRVNIKNPLSGTVRPRIYESRIGVKAYSFGARAPRNYQETLNPKYVRKHI